jgi:hypothetical protein
MTINWQEVTTTFLTTVGGGGVILAAAAWLIEKVLDNKFARDMEAFRSRLKADADVQIEKLKNSLQMTAVEHQVRFSKLHAERAEAIRDIYTQMVGVQWLGQRFAYSGMGSDQWNHQEDYNKTMKKIEEFAFFIDTRRFYLPRGICNLLDQFVDALRKTVIPIGVYGAIAFPNAETQTQRNKAAMDAFAAFEGKIPQVRTALETEFRAILGVE